MERAVVIPSLDVEYAIGKTFNVASDKNVSINQLISELEKVMGRRAEVKYVDPLPGDIKHNPTDISLVKKVLGFELGYDFEQ